MIAGSPPRILYGIRVVELSHALAGPHCGRHLADLGAEVTKVESPGAGDYTRHLAAAPGNQNSVYFSKRNGPSGRFASGAVCEGSLGGRIGPSTVDKLGHCALRSDVFPGSGRHCPSALTR
jgi:hypothetical protein